MTTAAIDGPWYRALSRSQWNALIASNLGWLFDGFETYALILTAGVALRQLLDPTQYAQIPSYIGTVIAITLLGWASAACWAEFWPTISAASARW